MSVPVKVYVTPLRCSHAGNILLHREWRGKGVVRRVNGTPFMPVLPNIDWNTRTGFNYYMKGKKACNG